jgi:hypothetical protein
MATNREASRRIDKEERAKAREEIRAADAAHRAARAALVSHLQETRSAKRAASKAVATDLQELRRRYRSAPRDLGNALAERRAAFRAWWRSVLDERQRRKDELLRLSELLANLKRTAPAALRHAIQERRRQAAADSEASSRASEARSSALSASARSTKRLAKGTRAGHRLGSGILSKRPPRTRKEAARSTSERKSEFMDAVASNLTATTAKWYRRHARMFPGESSGLTPDQVAERVVESLESEPESLVEDEQARADDWLREQLQEAGFL